MEKKEKLRGDIEKLGISDLSGNDQYSFYRDAYLQRREYEIRDGELEESLFDDDFD